MSAGKALRRALSRSADVLWDLALVVQSVEIDMLDQDGVVDALGPGDLLVVLDGPDGALGLACMHRALLTGLVEVQTIQQVTQIPVDDRPLTATDAAMAAPFLDDVLQRFANTLENNPLRSSLEGYRFGAMLEDKRAVAHLLNAPGYHSFRAEVDLALGRREGGLALFLPLADQTAAQKDMPREGRHAQAMQRLPVTIEATLARIAMPLDAAEALRPGDTLPLTPDVVDGVELRAGRSAVVARGRLGQMNGMRAVRLNWPPAPEGAQPAPSGGGGFEAAAPDSDAMAPAESPMGLPMGEGDMSFDGGLPDLPELPELPDLPEPGGMDFDASSDAEGFAMEGSPSDTGGEDFGLGDFESMDFDNLDFDAEIATEE